MKSCQHIRAVTDGEIPEGYGKTVLCNQGTQNGTAPVPDIHQRVVVLGKAVRFPNQRLSIVEQRKEGNEGKQTECASIAKKICAAFLQETCGKIGKFIQTRMTHNSIPPRILSTEITYNISIRYSRKECKG